MILIIRFIIQHIFVAIGFCLAPLTLAVRAILHHSLYFSDKMMDDLYGKRKTEYLVVENDNTGAKTMKSDCCGDSIRAKMNGNEVEFFYCNKCKSHIDSEDITKNEKK
jgi:hypothetical protein